MIGRIFNIQHYSLHDGPGIRTVFFLKGCPLRCRWCSNPESQGAGPEVYFDKDKCIYNKGCNRCVQVCEYHAVGRGQWDPVRCSHCLRCVSECPSQALNVYGRDMEVSEVLAAAEKQRPFYRHGGGGITLSGGDPLAQPAFALEILAQAKSRGFDTAIETCGYGDEEALRSIAAHTDHIIYDVKMMDEGKHIRYTGCSNRRILQNLEMLFREHGDKDILIRTPVIPGVNDREEDLAAIRDYLDRLGRYRYETLSYHRFGEKKYRMLGRPVPELG